MTDPTSGLIRDRVSGQVRWAQAAEPTRCVGHTRAGKPCRRNTHDRVLGFALCIAHNDQADAMYEDVTVCGAWARSYHGQAVTEIVDAEDNHWVFNPPNMLLLSGQRFRVEAYNTVHPVLAVEHFDSTIHRYALAKARNVVDVQLPGEQQ